MFHRFYTKHKSVKEGRDYRDFTLLHPQRRGGEVISTYYLMNKMIKRALDYYEKVRNRGSIRILKK